MWSSAAENRLSPPAVLLASSRESSRAVTRANCLNDSIAPSPSDCSCCRSDSSARTWLRAEAPPNRAPGEMFSIARCALSLSARPDSRICSCESSVTRSIAAIMRSTRASSWSAQLEIWLVSSSRPSSAAVSASGSEVHSDTTLSSRLADTIIASDDPLSSSSGMRSRASSMERLRPAPVKWVWSKNSSVRSFGAAAATSGSARSRPSNPSSIQTRSRTNSSMSSRPTASLKSASVSAWRTSSEPRTVTSICIRRRSACSTRSVSTGSCSWPRIRTGASTSAATVAILDTFIPDSFVCSRMLPQPSGPAQRGNGLSCRRICHPSRKDRCLI